MLLGAPQHLPEPSPAVSSPLTSQQPHEWGTGTLWPKGTGLQGSWASPRLLLVLPGALGQA